jgi:hypothetical protein
METEAAAEEEEPGAAALRTGGTANEHPRGDRGGTKKRNAFMQMLFHRIDPSFSKSLFNGREHHRCLIVTAECAKINLQSKRFLSSAPKKTKSNYLMITQLIDDWTKRMCRDRII